MAAGNMSVTPLMKNVSKVFFLFQSDQVSCDCFVTMTPLSPVRFASLGDPNFGNDVET